LLAGWTIRRKGEFFIGSADWMYRNLSKRVEVVTPIFAAEAKEKLWKVLDICLRDRRQAWMLNEDGRYSQFQCEGFNDGPEALGTQATFMEIAKDRAEAG
jgi:polyphosphate kinase